MKKIIYSFAIAAVALGFSSCKETWDENPVIKGHEGTVQADFLNNPALQDYPIMITQKNNTGTFHLTCSQPDFGYAAIATYKVQCCLDDKFEEGTYIEIKQAFYNCAEINPVNSDIAAAYEKLLDVKSEADLPTPYNRLYMRLRAYIEQSPENTQYVSNPVYFDQVAADYLAIWVPDVAKNMYLRGSFDAGWGALPEWQFYTGTEENTWVIKGIVTLAKDTQFKVADSSWGACNWGGPTIPEGGSMGPEHVLKPGDEYELNTGDNPGNMKIESDFTGRIQLRMEGDDYFLLFDPVAAE